MKTDLILINQTLHGYADGHQLISASTELTRGQNSQLLMMSDLSGPSFRTGYESYLTGHGIGEGTYAIAKTWFAPELPRPGCVWTHTLLVRDEDVARLPSLSSLSKLFRRPEAGKFSSYERPIKFIAPDWEPARKLSGLTKLVVSALYESDRIVVIPSERSELFETTVLAILDQQWPKLRRTFSFCTGALSLRDAGFDLSVCPPEVANSLNDAAVVVGHSALHDRDEWVDVATRDVENGEHDTPFRKFLWAFGPDFKEGRLAFRPLTEIFNLIMMNEQLLGGKVLSLVGHHFPKSTEGKRIKSAIFGQDGPYLESLGGEKAVIALLVSHQLASAIPGNVAEVEQRAANLAKDDPQAALAILRNAADIGTEYAQAFIRGYLNSAGWGSGSAPIPDSLLPYVLNKNPSLLSSPELWTRLSTEKSASAPIAYLRSHSEHVPSAIAAMVHGKAWLALRSAVDRLGPMAMYSILRVIEEISSKIIEVEPKLASILLSQSYELGDALATGSAGPRALRYLTAILDPQSWYLKRTQLADWAEASRQRFRFSDIRHEINSAVFLIVLGLSSREEGGEEIVVSNFQVVFDALNNDFLDEVTWKRLDSVLAYHSSKSKGPHLVRTVVRAFRDRDWSTTSFLRTFVSDTSLELAFSELEDSRAGRNFSTRVIEEVSGGKYKGPNELSPVLKRFLKKKNRKPS